MNTKNTRKGFTTVELVIVIAVIAILATVLIPTFSNMIEKANLSVDQQAVRNMNVCLAGSKIIYNDPSAAGNIRAYLREYGYGTEDNFKTKSKNHRICWYVDKVVENGEEKDISVILLVNDETNEVVYPEEYTELRVADNGLILGENLFDLSLPLMVTDRDTAVSVNIDLNNTPVPMELSVQYTFTADPEASDKYSNWSASFFVTVDLPEGVDEADLLLAGNRMDEGEWQLLPLCDIVEGRTYDLLVDTGLIRGPLKYYELQDVIKVFECGVISPDYTYSGINAYEFIFGPLGNQTKNDPTGTVMTVELRLTNPEDANDQVVIGIFNYTFQ